MAQTAFSPQKKRHQPQQVLSAQAVVLLLATALYAIAEQLYAATGGLLPLLLSLVAGALFGLLLSLLVHEWSHYAGARLAAGEIQPVTRLRLFVFNWDFTHNGPRQFMAMSYAGTAGSLLALVLLILLLSPPSPGAAAAITASAGSLAFAAVIEWPVLLRVHRGKSPLEALQGIRRHTLLIAAAASALVVLLVGRSLLPLVY